MLSEPDAAERVKLHPGLSRSAALFHHLRQVLGLPVKMFTSESGGASSMLVVSMKKEYPEQVKEVAWGAWSLMNKRESSPSSWMTISTFGIHFRWSGL
jgi:3-polyprenyl-4-hydroxybenzoate decarboxylase